MRFFFGCLFVFLSVHTYCQDDIQIFRYPSINSDGTQIAFTYQGDIWVADAMGNDMRRLTIHEAYDYTAQWSPDDQKILFSSSRYGNDDLFTIDADGQDLQRLTYNSAGDYFGSWKDQATIHFSTRRNFAQVEREGEYYEIGAEGGTPYRSLDALGLESSYSNDGKILAFVRGTCRPSREAYRGPANRDIWSYNAKKDSYIQLTTDEGQDMAPNFGDGKNLYFLSARTGRYNIYKLELKNDGSAKGQPTAITNYTQEGIDYFDISRDGSTMIYTLGGTLYVQSTVANSSARKLNMNMPGDYRFDPDEYMSYKNGSREIALSPNEERIAYTVRGEIFIKKNDEDKSLSVAPAKHPYRETNIQWLNDTTLLFLSDRDGDYDLFEVKAKGGGDLFETFEWTVNKIIDTPNDEGYFEIAPDKSKIAIVTIDGILSMVDIDSNGIYAPPIELMSGWNAPDDLSWSPDSKWIAYSQADLDFNSEIYIRKADPSGYPINVSMHPRGDYDPVWSRDGSKLGFLSIRNNGDSDVWFAWLNKEDYERTSSDWEDMDEDEDKGDIDSTFYIDVEGIHERLVQVTRLSGNEYNLLISDDGEEFFFSTNGGSRQGATSDPVFKKVKWNGEDMSTVVGNGRINNLILDKKGKNIYYISRGLHKSVDTGGKKSKSLPFNAKMQIDNIAERTQIFDEAWRTLRDKFYDPQFHGQDWDQLRALYEPRALAASTKQDFTYMTNLMLGQLNSSHMGLRGGVDEQTQRIRTGRLGIEMRPVEGGVEVTRVVPNSPADKKQSKLNVGDKIVAVNGVAIGNNNFYAMVNMTIDERIQLTLAEESGERNVIIRPSSSTRNLLYEEWVNDRKKLVEKYSNGRLGYIHIRGMNWSSFERFERELMASGYGKDGVVIDVRFNGGGWTTDMVMAVLNVRQHSYTIPRGATDNLDRDNKKYKEHYPYGERLPLSSWTKPSIALCNQNSYSNAEIFSHAFKTLGHGSLVGMPTFGAVISTGGRGLMDGFYVRVPFRAWYVKATGENMEHGPAVPDYIIENAPDSRARNEDEQLKKSVEVLLGEIDGQ